MSPKALVTGASGYIGSWLVKYLLEEGYSVVAGVKDKNDQEKVRHLEDLGNELLTMCNIELNDPSSLTRATSDCELVFHCASPTDLTHVHDADEEVVNPARNGVLNMLQACSKSGTVKRVIFTSCITSMMYQQRDPGAQFDINPDKWSDESFLRENKLWYHLSKTVAERAAWQFMEKGDRDFDLFCVHPGLTFGPSLSPRITYSLNLLLGIIKGEHRHLPNIRVPVVDVRDVAQSHILIAEKAQEPGRYVCVAQVIRDIDLFETIHIHYPKFKTPKQSLPMTERKIGILRSAPSKKLQELGFTFKRHDVSISDSLLNFKENNLLK